MERELATKAVEQFNAIIKNTLTVDQVMIMRKISDIEDDAFEVFAMQRGDVTFVVAIPQEHDRVLTKVLYW